MSTETQETAGSTTTQPETKVAETVVTTEAAKPESKSVEVAATEGTKAEPVKANEKPVVPEKYDLKLPKGAILPEAKLEEFALYAKEKGLTNEQAQEQFTREANAVTEHMAAMRSSHEANIENWKQESVKDPELGGDKLGENLEMSKRAIEHFATPEFKKLLDDTGFGNHKEVLRLFSNIGKQMSEGKIHSIGSQGTPESTAIERLYPSMAKNRK